MSTHIADPANYRAMLTPHTTMDDANASVRGFYEAVSEARKRFKLADVHIIISSTVLEGERERPVMTTAHFGEPLNAEWMSAFALASAKRDREDNIKSILKEILTSKPA